MNKVEDKFLFVFLDDSTLDVVSPAENLVGSYEGIDVEKGLYTFFDQDLRKMEPQFIEPNQKGRTIGIPWVASGVYELIAGEIKKEDFLKMLSEIVHVNKNDWFKTIDDIRLYLEQ